MTCDNGGWAYLTAGWARMAIPHQTAVPARTGFTSPSHKDMKMLSFNIGANVPIGTRRSETSTLVCKTISYFVNVNSKDFSRTGNTISPTRTYS